ncbi:PAS domain-containing protein [Halobacillus mangrovi]|uniref:PAS domain-containing protein n=1 Tax=Halobacillus mangrovi TaxID=402384 RepID=UPI003D99BA98
MILQDALDSLDEGILITDENDKVVYMNSAYGHLFQLAACTENMKDHFELLHSRFSRIGEVELEQELNVVVRFQEQTFQLYKRQLRENGENYLYYRLIDVTPQEKLKEQYNQVIEEMVVHVMKISKGYALIHLPPLYSEDLKIILLERVPLACQNQHVTRLALYLSSISEMDPGWPDLLEKLTKTLKLLGIEVVLAGIRPSFVLQVTRAGIRFNHVRTFLNLEQATAYLSK